MRSEETKRYKSAISGVLIVDKPIGKTSHDIVQIIRKGTGIRRIGHTGTLDPRASGVLVILIGPAVRLSEYLQSDIKRYEATIRLGSVSDTYDGDGLIETTGADMNISEDQISEAMKKFVGEIEQTPPVYSALKIKGRKAYEMAREGIAFEIPSRKVTVYSMDLIEYNPPELSVDILCSSGTYVRSIANDLGQVLGCGAYLSGLRRTLSGHFSLRDAVSIPNLEASFEEGNWYQYLIPAAEALDGYAELVVDMDEESQIRHGRRIPAQNTDSPYAKAVSEQGELIAILELDPETSEWKPKKVLYP